MSVTNKAKQRGKILDEIMAYHREQLPKIKREVPLNDVQAFAMVAPPPLDFYAALAKPGVSLIAECKKASPSKGLIARDRSQSVHIIEAALSREEYAGQRLAELAEKLSDGSFSPLFMHLVKNEKLSDSDLASLRKLIRKSKGRKK